MPSAPTNHNIEGTETVGQFAAVIISSGVEVDQLFADTVAKLKIDGVRLAGYLQREDPENTTYRSALYLENIVTGEKIKISQSLGSGSKGCRLDPSTLAELTKILSSEISTKTDLLILNRFGKGESDGQGFRIAIEKAITAGIPVLTAVRTDYLEAWRSFSGEFGVEIIPTAESIFAWCNTVLKQAGNRVSQ